MSSVISKKRRRSIYTDGTQQEKRSNKTTIIYASTSSSSELMEHLAEKRKQLKEANTTELDSRKKILEQELLSCAGKRWLKLRALDIQHELNEIQQKRKNILDKKPLQDFDRIMKPILRRLKQASEKKETLMLEDAERQVRKHLTKLNESVAIKRALIGDLCEDCGISMRVIANDSLLGCPSCAKTRPITSVTAPLADSEFISTPYQQKSRLSEWLEFCQGKEYAEPDPDVMQSVMEELYRNRQTGLEAFAPEIYLERKNGPFLNADDAIERLEHKIPKLKEKLLAIKPNEVRTAMQNVSSTKKDDKVRKFYERSPKFSAYISGFWPVRFTNAQEARITDLYNAAIPAYEKYRKPSQPNWPGGYGYFLSSVCILLGWDEFIPSFNVSSTSPKNSMERELMRQKIWTINLDWEYIPTYK
jgi:hypothetical protein